MCNREPAPPLVPVKPTLPLPSLVWQRMERTCFRHEEHNAPCCSRPCRRNFTLPRRFVRRDLFVFVAMAPVAAQQGDLNAISKRFKELYAAGNYPAALVEAQKSRRQRRGLGSTTAITAAHSTTWPRVHSRKASTPSRGALQARARDLGEGAGANHPDVAMSLNNLASVTGRKASTPTPRRLQARAGDPRKGARRRPPRRGPQPQQPGRRVQDKASTPTPSRSTSARWRSTRRRSAQTTPTWPRPSTTWPACTRTKASTPTPRALYKRALAIREKALGPDHPDVASTLNNLAERLRDQGKYAEAEGLYKRALAIREKALGADHPDVAQTPQQSGHVYQDQGKYADAEGSTSVRWRSGRRRAAGHPDVANFLNDLARLTAQPATARAHSPIPAKRQRPSSPTRPPRRRAGSEMRVRAVSSSSAPSTLLAISPTLRRRHRSGSNPGNLGREALAMAQWANQLAAAAGSSKWACASPPGAAPSPTSCANARPLRLVARSRQGADPGAVEAERPTQRDHIESIRKQIADTENKIAAVAARLAAEFPDYAALASPKPLKAEEIQSVLGPEEAGVFFLTGDKESNVFALTREAFEWRTIPLGAKALSQKALLSFVRLDREELAKCPRPARAVRSRPRARALSSSHRSGRARSSGTSGISSWCPRAALTALPFHLLVTEKPAGGAGIARSCAYRDAAWLFKRHAVSVLPSVASLKALRGSRARRGEAAADRLRRSGFQCRGGRELWPAAASQSRALPRPAPMPSSGRVDIDRTMLGQALPRLPETAAELAARWRKKPRCAASSIHLQKDASETT